MGNKKTHICDGAVVTYCGIKDEHQLHFRVDDEIPTRFVDDVVKKPVNRTILSLQVYNAINEVSFKEDSTGLYMVITLDREYTIYNPQQCATLINDIVVAVVADTRRCTHCTQEARAAGEHPVLFSRVGVTA